MPGRIIKNIAVVGNGPVGYRDSRTIDRCDLVLRFNKAKYGSVYGRRTDVMVFSDLHRTGRMRFNRRAFKSATEFWVGLPLGPTATNNGEHLARSKIVRLLDKDATARSIAPFAHIKGKIPSAGAMAIQRILEVYPIATINLFGFSHQGNDWHDWDAERDWCNSLILIGSMHRHNSTDNRLQKTILALKRGWVRFFEHFGEGRPIES